jgi:hypothetical protein
MAKDHDIAMQILENNYGGNEPFKGGFSREPRFKNANKKESVCLWGLGSH